MKHIFKYFLLISLITGFLTACHFQFRNQNELPSQLRVLYLQSNDPYGQFTQTLRQTLLSSGIILVRSPTEAPVILNITNTHLSYATTTIGTSSQSRVYTVVYSATYALTNPAGETILDSQVVSASGNLTLSANQLLDSNNQLTLLEQELQREVINKIFNRLSSRKTFDALTHETGS
jgi:outer membrane lipopolysaccharide assembly protein LptE/RlpB